MTTFDSAGETVHHNDPLAVSPLVPSSDGSRNEHQDESHAEPHNGTSAKALAAGGSALAVAMFAANAGNYLLNVVLGRWLTPAEFADANLMVTLMLLVTAIAVSLQLIAARFAGINQADGAVDRTSTLAAVLERRALLAGVALLLVLVLGATIWRDFFNSASAIPFVILGLGMPAYIAQAVGRGVLQGQLQFRPLAMTFVIEMIVRVTLGIGLVALGLGVTGATIALSLSFIATWVAVRRSLQDPWPLTNRAAAKVPTRVPASVIRYAVPVGVLLLGQIIINNGDVLIAKRSLVPDLAGVYAAIALIGRAVFFLSWSVATTLFPAAAQREQRGESSHGLLHGGLVVVGLLGVAAVAGAALLGGTVLGTVFGPAYGGVSRNLALYALATSLFAMANLIVSHHLALGRLREAILLVGGGIIQTALLLSMQDSIDQLVKAQIIAMSILLAIIGASHVQRLWADGTRTRISQISTQIPPTPTLRGTT